MSAQLFYGGLIAFAVGVGLETRFDLSPAVILWFLLLSFVLGVLWRRDGGGRSGAYDLERLLRPPAAVPAPLLLGSVLLLGFSLGLLRTEVASWQFGVSPLESQVNGMVTLTGVVVAEPDERERTTQLTVQTETDKVLVSTDRLTEIAYGDTIEITGKLEQPDAFTTDLGRTFDYVGYLRARGIEYRISFASVAVQGSGDGNVILDSLLTFKQHFITHIQKIIPEPAVGLGAGLLLGVKSALGADIEDDFRRTGIIHIVVLSGYNVMLVVAFIMFCFSYLLAPRWRLLAGILAIVAFALMVGLSATVVRASIMASLVLLAQYFGRTYHVLRALCLAGAIMLFINPYLLIYDIGFQLSFMATLGLVLLLPRFETAFLERNVPVGIREFLLATIATQIAVLPLLMYHIGEVSLIAVVVNVLVLPVVPLAMFATFLTGMVAFVSVSLASIVGYAATVILTYILVVADWFAALPFAAVTVPTFGAWGVFALYLAPLTGWLLLKYWKREKGEMADWVVAEEPDPVKPEDDPNAMKAAGGEKELPVFFRPN